MALFVDLYQHCRNIAMEIMPTAAPLVAWKPNLAPKQVDLIKLCKSKTGNKKLIGVFGTRMSGKSCGSMHAIADHMWNTKDASVLILCSTAGAAATSGIWNELTERILPEWIGGDFGMTWEMEPKIHGATKKMLCSVTNKHGGISKLELDSLDDEREVEKRYKSRYYSMIYWSEAGEFKQMLSLSTLIMALRVMTLQPDDHILIVDANPPDEGQDHFLFKFFFEIRLAVDLDKDDPFYEVYKTMQKCIHCTEWTMNDNPYLTEDTRNLVKGNYMNDPDQYDRYIRGMWKKATKGALFSANFITNVHTVGNIRDLDPEILLPSENCTELISSHDAGGVNPVSYIFEKIIEMRPFTDRKTGKEVWREVSIFHFLEELAYIGQSISVSEFTAEHMEQRKIWESECTGIVTWRDWSDRSATDVTESIANRTVADEMFIESEGEIQLVGVEKGAGSVSARVRFWRKLLNEQRLKISAARCPKLIEMNQNIKCGKTPDSIATHSPYKHPFDAATYGVAKECWDEMETMIATIRNPNIGKERGIISIRL